MLIDNINLNHIRIFESVYRTKSMTKAAEELHMTQSGVSQHIKLLEEMLEVKLFDRIKQRLIPTSTSIQLFDHCSDSLYKIEQALKIIKGKDQLLSGNISIGLPIEFGNNVILPLLSDFAKKNHEITYTISYGLTSEINNLLIKGQLDFAIVDDFLMDKLIRTVKVYEENLQLCCSKNYFLEKKEALKGAKENKQFFESLDYIAYDKNYPVLISWFKYHFKNQNISKYKIRAIMLSITGISKLILDGFGVGVLPSHVIKKLLDDGHDLHIFREDQNNLKNAISLAYVKDRTKTMATNTLIEFLINSLV